MGSFTLDARRALRTPGTLLGLGLLAVLGCSVEQGGSSTGSLTRADQSVSPEFPAGRGDAAVGDTSYPQLDCPQGGDTGPVRVVFECDRIVVITCKDLSNVVLELSDGTHVRHQGLKGHQNVFEGADLVGVWVKAGANHSGDGPGYGERFDAPDAPCSEPPAPPSEPPAPPVITVDAGVGPTPF